MKLYYNPLSTYSQKVMIAFNEKDIAYDGEVVDLMTPEGRAAYEQIYPIGKLPFLKPSDDWQVPESTAIIEYLDDNFAQTPRLIPAGGGDAARQVRLMDRMADLYFNDPVTELLFQGFGFRAKDDERAARARKFIEVTYDHWNQRLASQPWLCGEALTIADCAAIPPLFYAQIAAPFERYANVAAYWQRAQKRPSYAKARAEFEPIWEEIAAGRHVA